MHLSRRAILGGALAAAAIPAVGVASPLRATAATAVTLPLNLVNNSGAGTVNFYITGVEPGTGRPVMVQADGSLYRPASPHDPVTPLGVDVKIPVQTERQISLPRLDSGRVWFVMDDELQFAVNPGPALVMPSPNTTPDLRWSFTELTFNADQLYANLTFVDFASVPVAMTMGETHVAGISPGGVGQLAELLTQQANRDGAPWDKLILRDSAGTPLRVLSPLASGVDFGDYFDEYVNRVWDRYRTQDLVIDTQSVWGKVAGRVVGDVLEFPGVGTFTQPSTASIFSCSIAPFTTANDLMGNLSARLAASFNRTTLLTGSEVPSISEPYTEARTNHYARLVHQVQTDGLGYAFPYDDVLHAGAPSVEGKIQSAEPSLLTITVGSPV